MKSLDYYKKRKYSYISFGLLILSFLISIIFQNKYIFLLFNVCSFVACIISYVKKETYPFLYVCTAISVSALLLLIGIDFAFYGFNICLIFLCIIALIRKQKYISLYVFIILPSVVLALYTILNFNYYNNMEIYEKNFYGFKSYLESAAKNINNVNFDEQGNAIISKKDLGELARFLSLKLGDCEYYVSAKKVEENKVIYRAELSCKGKYNYKTTYFDDKKTQQQKNNNKEKSTVDDKYKDYSFDDVKTYDEDTNGKVYINNTTRQYYKSYEMKDEKNNKYNLNINFDGSICQDTLNDTCVTYKESVGRTVYASYIFDVDKSSTVYVIDRQGYLLESTTSNIESGIDRYSNAKVLKIGSRGSSVELLFEDNTTLEFTIDWNVLDLNYLYRPMMELDIQKYLKLDITDKEYKKYNINMNEVFEDNKIENIINDYDIILKYKIDNYVIKLEIENPDYYAFNWFLNDKYIYSNGIGYSDIPVEKLGDYVIFSAHGTDIRSISLYIANESGLLGSMHQFDDKNGIRLGSYEINNSGIVIKGTRISHGPSVEYNGNFYNLFNKDECNKNLSMLPKDLIVSATYTYKFKSGTLNLVPERGNELSLEDYISTDTSVCSN